MHIPPPIQDALNRNVRSLVFVENDIVASADEPKAEALVASDPSGMRPKLGMFSKLAERLFSPHPEQLSRFYIVVGCEPGINSREVLLRPLADEHSHQDCLASALPRCQIPANTFLVKGRCGLSLP